MRLRDYQPTHTERYVQKGASQKAANMGSLEGKAVETIWAKLSPPKPTMTPKSKKAFKKSSVTPSLIWYYYGAFLKGSSLKNAYSLGNKISRKSGLQPLAFYNQHEQIGIPSPNKSDHQNFAH